MYSSGAHVFLFLLFLANQNSGGEAGACKRLYRTDTRDWESNGEIYTCTVTNVPYCKGGCAATVKYDLHVSDSLSSNRRCSTDVNQCVEDGEEYKNFDSDWSCVLKIDNTPATNPPLAMVVPSNCACHVVYGSSTSVSDCENKISKLI